MRAPSNLRWWRCQSGNPPKSLYVRRTRSPLKLGPELRILPRPELFTKEGMRETQGPPSIGRRTARAKPAGKSSVGRRDSTPYFRFARVAAARTKCDIGSFLLASMDRRSQ